MIARSRPVSSRRSGRRLGAVTVEFALAAPLLFLLVFSGFELSRVNMMRNSIENAAYEGARRGILQGASADDCKAATQSLLDIVAVSKATVTVTPEVIDGDTETVTVTVEVQLDQSNSYVTPRYYLGNSLRASITLPRELG